MSREAHGHQPRRRPYDMGRVRRVHFVGIGGAGMSGIAEVLLNLGFEVSGSDKADNRATRRLTELGACVYRGHDAEHVEAADVLVTSTAVPADNPEILRARERRIPVVPRAEMLGELMRFRQGIAVAGTHGKTSTTSLVASVLGEGGLDPTFVIGGLLNSADSHARLGAGTFLVAEADESDGSFRLLQPTVAVVTNIDLDHMATYGGDVERLHDAFIEFLQHLPFYGLAVLCIDDPGVRTILPRVTRQVLTYGESEDADIRATDVQQTGRRMQFQVWRPDSERPLALTLNLPGRHNVANALAAVALAWELGVADERVQRALSQFQGIGRRFDVLPQVAVRGGEVTLVDDYGHHPTEIAAVLATLRTGWPDSRVVAVFQPHRYSRTHDLLDDFARVLSGADVLVLTEVYAAGEAPIAGADGRALARAVRARGQIDPVLCPELEELPAVLASVAAPGDVLAFLGAGNIGAWAQHIAKEGLA